MERVNAKLLFTLLSLIVALPAIANFSGLSMPKPPFSAPDFKVQEESQWLNSPPLSLSQLRGKVVLVDFWTFGCINCTRSIPWLKSVEAKYRDAPFQMVGVHTPEFAHEKVRDNVVKKSESLGRHHAIVIDNDFAIWRSYQNRYWPAFYIIDKRGVVRGVYVGETHKGDSRSKAIEGLLDKLIAEK